VLRASGPKAGRAPGDGACSVGGGGGGGVEDLKRANGEKLLSVERAARAFIYIGVQMHDARLMRRVAHFVRRVAHYFYMRDAR
jgi:hypothetical protein